MQTPPANIDLSPEMMDALLETASACAVVLMVAGADHFTVAAGTLAEAGFQEMQTALQRYWPSSSQRNLNRYIGLYLDGRFYYLFAKFLPNSSYLLSLVFSPHTPLVRIRQDMTNTMRQVLQSIRDQLPPGDGVEQSLQFRIKPYPALMTHQNPRERVAAEESPHAYEVEAVPDQTNPHFPDHTPEGQHPVSAGQDGLSSGAAGMDWVPLDGMLPAVQEIPPGTGSRLSETPAAGVNRSSEASLGPDQEWRPLEEAPQPEPDLVRLFHSDLDFPQGPPDLENIAPSADRVEPGLDPVMEPWKAETKPNRVVEAQPEEHIQLSDITFYLVPKNERHFVLGELAWRLRGWFPGICETYGWQLDALSVRPDYIKWRLHDFPDALTHEMLEIVRARTSERIFRVFPNLRGGPPADDFWSPGYLVDRQNQDLSTQVLIARVEPRRNPLGRARSMINY